MQKNEGNQRFKDKKYSEASEFYRDAIEVLDLIEHDRDRKDVKEMMVSVHQNLAICLNQTEDYDEAIFHCNEALAVTKSAKAYYIKSQTYQKQTEYLKAITELKECIQLQPNDRKLRDELEKVRKLEKE